MENRPVTDEPLCDLLRNHGAVMLLIHPESGRIVDANLAATRFYGYDLETLRSLSIDQLNLLPREEVEAERQRALNEERNFFVFPHRLASGETRTVEVHSSPVEVNGQRLLFSIVHDATKRQRAERDLRVAEERWKLALDGSTEEVWDWDPRTDRVYSSPRWKQLLGLEEAARGDQYAAWEALIHPDDLAQVRAALQAHLDGQTPRYVSEHRLRHRDGAWRWVLARGMVVSRTPEGRPQRVVGTHADVTERRAMEQALRDTNRRLEEALSRVGVLEGILTVCSFCKQVRDEKGEWQPLEVYLTRHSEAQFSHTYCPSCGKQYFAEFMDPEDE